VAQQPRAQPPASKPASACGWNDEGASGKNQQTPQVRPLARKTQLPAMMSRELAAELHSPPSKYAREQVKPKRETKGAELAVPSLQTKR